MKENNLKRIVDSIIDICYSPPPEITSIECCLEMLSLLLQLKKEVEIAPEPISILESPYYLFYNECLKHWQETHWVKKSKV